MKNKLITILAALTVAALAATGAVTALSAKAADKPYGAEALFSDPESVDVSGDTLALELKKDSPVSFGKKVQTADFSLELGSVSLGSAALTVTFRQTDLYGEEIENKLVLTADGYKVNENEKVSSAVSGDVTIALKGTALTLGGASAGTFDEAEKREATLEFSSDTDDVRFVVKSLSGQSFALSGGNVTDADGDGGVAPSIVSNDDSFVFYPTEEEAIAAAEQAKPVLLGVRFKPAFDAYDVLASSLTNSFAFKKYDTAAVPEEGEDEEAKDDYVIESDPTYLSGSVDDKWLVRIRSTDEAGNMAEVFAMVVLTDPATQTAPSYKDETEEEDAYAGYRERVKAAALKKEKDLTDEQKEDGITHYIDIGSGQYYNIPSLEAILSFPTAYNDLSFTVYYDTPSATGRSTTNMRIEVTEPGTYTYYVIPRDTMGRHPIKDDCPTFTFVIENTEKPIVTAGTTQNTGYVGLSFTSRSFTIKGYGTSAKYTLWYTDDVENASETTDEGWTEAEETLSTLTFTPKKLGTYRIKCVVTGGNNLVADPVYSKNITVVNPEIVRNRENWAKNNVLSIVFLSIAGASLIGIIVLLCIKPKEKAADKPAASDRKAKKQ